MNETNVLHIVETCTNLRILFLPFNPSITGWFLETLLERRRRGEWTRLEKLKLYINTAYVDIQTVIPELYAAALATDLSNLGLHLDVRFAHNKLRHFNPLYLDIKDHVKDLYF